MLGVKKKTLNFISDQIMQNKKFTFEFNSVNTTTIENVLTKCKDASVGVDWLDAKLIKLEGKSVGPVAVGLMSHHGSDHEHNSITEKQ